MPRRRKGFLRRNITHSNIRNYAKTGMSVAATAALALKTAMLVKSLVNAELKFIDTAGTASYTTTASVNAVSAIVQGPQVNARVGNSVKFVSFYLSGSVKIGAAATVPEVLRIILFTDTNPNASIPLATDLLMASSVDALRNPLTNKRFRVLYDRKCTLQPNGTEVIHIDKYIKHTLHAEYLDTSAATSCLGQNQVFILIVSDQTVNAPSFNWTVRCRYYDN